MKKKFFDIKKISGFTKRNLLIVWFVLCVCVSVSVSAYLVSEVTSLDGWSMTITHLPSTPTPTLAPDTGWWSAIVTPTPLSKK